MEQKSPSLMPAVEQMIDIKQVWMTLMKYKWLIMFFSIVVTSIATMVALSKPSIYTSTATLLIESKQAKAVSVEEVYGLDPRINEYFLTQFEILKSDAIAMDVINKLDLINNPEFNPNLTPKKKLIDFDLVSLLPFLANFKKPPVAVSPERLAFKTEQQVLSAFKSKLAIMPIRKTQLVRISFKSENPQLAADIANAVGNAYIESNLDATLQVANKASGWLNERMSTLKTALQQSEETLQRFLQDEGLVDIEGVGGLASQELNELTTQLNHARDRRVASESLNNMLQENSNSVSQLTSIPEITNHPVIRDSKLAVSTAQRKVSDLSKRYGPKHPTMKAANAELRNARANLNQEIKQLMAGLSTELAAAKQAEKTLESELEKRKFEYQSLTVKSSQYAELKREVDSNRQLYDLFLTRYKETSASSDFGSTIARFTDNAKPALFPSAPNRKMMVIIAFVFAFGFACVVAFVVEAMNDTFTRVKQVEPELGVNLLGVLPEIKVKKKKLPVNIYFDEKQKAYSEGIRSIRTGYMLSNMNQENKVLMLTSSEPNEGKTSVSVSLAYSLAQLEKTILIDCDLRRPSLAKRFGIPASQPGLANLIAGTHSFEECLVKDEATGLDVLVAGLIPPNPQELIASANFGQLISNLKQQYNRVVIDTAPCQAVSDALLISKNVDSCILVTKAEQTRTVIVKQTLGKLVQQGVKIDGVILNNLNMKKAQRYGDFESYSEYYSAAQVAV
ncbi:GumC family protein [Motilimonas pumila]|uniref:non-specific protein-tyrosine kinase n=1 Tax=Motilimonas pumila TaxID=2303987 RepID=A0A418YF59_9GAMM|nr:polysaccharide biosynthesis tyrosine autokinase [Motilimonas pumila]RJG47907.1 polysaccharide biosynthesis tyrosine autokinase [Motilimonas pumila]